MSPLKPATVRRLIAREAMVLRAAEHEYRQCVAYLRSRCPHVDTRWESDPCGGPSPPAWCNDCGADVSREIHEKNRKRGDRG